MIIGEVIYKRIATLPQGNSHSLEIRAQVETGETAENVIMRLKALVQAWLVSSLDLAQLEADWAKQSADLDRLRREKAEVEELIEQLADATSAIVEKRSKRDERQ